MLSEDQKNALRENLYGKSVRELVEYIIQAQEELQEAKEIRRRLIQIRNLATDPKDRRSVGRPKKGEQVV